MPNTAPISLSALWDETVTFFRAELALVLPVAFLGFGLPMIVLLLAVPIDAMDGGQVKPGPWMLWTLPCGFFVMLGSLGVSALALHPGATVKECLGVMLSRTPSALGLVVLNFGVQILLALPVTAVALAETAATGAAGVFTNVANLAVFAGLIWLFVRVLPIWALLAHRPLAPWAAVREAFALTRGHYRKLLLLRIAAPLLGLVALFAVLVPVGAIFTLLGKATGADEIAETLSFVATGMAFAALLALWTIYVARLYARLAGSSNGI